MSLDNIIEVNITAQTTTPTRAGFGTPLIFAYKEDNLTSQNRVREYSSLSEMTDDTVVNWSTTDTAYKIAEAIKSQDPSVSSFKVGLRRPPTKSFEITPTTTVEGSVLSIDFDGSTASYTVQAGDTIALIVTGLTTAIDSATTDPTVTDSTTHVTVTYNTAGLIPEIDNVSQGLDVVDTTADPGVASDLDDIVGDDNDWYALVTDSHSKAETLAIAAWVETKTKIFVAQQTSALANDDEMAGVQSSAYARTSVFYHPHSSEWLAASAVGKVLPEDPGSQTWNFKTLSGVDTYFINSTMRSDIESKDGNYYERVAGVNITRGGGTAGDGEYMDVRRGIDWLTARIQENVYTVLINNDKLPFTNQGLSVIKGVVLRQLNRAVERDFLDGEGDKAPTVTVPDVSDVSSANKGNRHLPDVEFTGRLAGAVHSVKIEGTLTL